MQLLFRFQKFAIDCKNILCNLLQHLKLFEHFEHEFCLYILKRHYKFLIFLNKIIKKEKNKIAFFGWPDFSGNSRALYNYLEKNRNYKLIWITQEDLAKCENVNFASAFRFKGLYEMLTADIVFNSNFSIIKFHRILGNKKQRYINLWHGMPIKKIFNLHIRHDTTKKQKANIRDFIKYQKITACATSEFWQTIISACFLSDIELTPITGQPRNDYLCQNISKEMLAPICDYKSYNKIILFAPTFSKYKEECGVNDYRLIQISDFDISIFNEYLKENNILMIAKLHPMEESLYENHFQEYSNIKLLNRFTLQKLDIELDNILGCFDMLITDYSSIYVDYLLANKPILFLKQNYEEYMDKRGFIMGENYSFFCPGPMISNYDELKKSILTELNDDNYKKEREKIRSLFHKYTDGKACERICKYLNI